MLMYRQSLCRLPGWHDPRLSAVDGWNPTNNGINHLLLIGAGFRKHPQYVYHSQKVVTSMGILRMVCKSWRMNWNAALIPLHKSCYVQLVQNVGFPPWIRFWSPRYIAQYKVVPQVVCVQLVYKYYFTRVYGGYIYSYWDYEPTYNWGGTTLYGKSLFKIGHSSLADHRSPIMRLFHSLLGYQIHLMVISVISDVQYVLNRNWVIQQRLVW